MVEFLLKKEADIHVKNLEGKTALHYASQSGEEGIAKFLLEKGADVNAKDLHDVTPLHEAISAKSTNLTQILLDNGADIEAKNDRENTPLHIAVSIRFIEGANVNTGNSNGENAYKLTISTGIASLIDIINQADKQQSQQTELNKSASPARASSKTHGTPATLDKELLSAIENDNLTKVKEIINKGDFDVNAKDESGSTALHYAAILENPEITKLLLSKGANINDVDNHGNTTLHHAVLSENNEMVNLLLSTKGIEINAKDALGNTALHLAAKEDLPNIVEALIKNGANVNEENKNMKTALDLAPQENIRAYRAIKSAGGKIGELIENIKSMKNSLVNTTATSFTPTSTPTVKKIMALRTANKLNYTCNILKV